MTEKNGAAFPSPEDNSNHRHLENVVDELRNVLSDLGRSVEKAPEPVPTPTPPMDFPEQHEEREFLRSAPPPFEAINPAPVESAPVSSDADFWNGNVLGWADKTDSPSENALPEIDPLVDMNFQDLGGPISTSKANKVLGELGSPESDGNSIWGEMEEPLINPPPELPKAPESPLEKFVTKEVPKIPEPIPDNPFSPTFSAFSEEVAPLPGLQESSPKPPFVPIPQTLERKPEAVKPNPDPNLNLEAPDLKPKGVIQIACIFPEGQEKLGQSFVSRLREIGEKSKKPVNIQAVFVHPWSSGNVDIPAWKKSALLSGADTMFVLVPKALSGSLKSLSSDLMGEVKSRVVFLEHIPMKTLYADILVDFQRGK